MVSDISMPCSYSIDKERKLLTCTGWGRLTAAEAAKLQKEFTDDPDFRRDLHQIVDLMAVTDLIADSAELRELAIKAPFQEGSRRAILVKNKVEYGIARMTQAYREISGGRDEIRIFEDRDQALQWLLSA